ncbi:MAG TPA: hypothetical protein VJX67_06530, partial [Blastocatellia bacterium]|nr:hypothetical protein [Blastocatellia bacterium]
LDEALRADELALRADELALRADELAHRRGLIQSIKGKYAHLGLSSDQFADDKASEVELEDR